MASQTTDSGALETLLGILTSAISNTALEITTLVGHRFPDDDVWLCFWIAKKFLPQTKNAKMVVVESGTSLLESEDDPSVLHFDTGGGEYDQHTQGKERTCSALILAENLLVEKDPGLIALLEMVTKVDNVEPLLATEIHSAILGYPRIFHENGDINWEKVQERVFELFEMIYAQETLRAENREKLGEHVSWANLNNGLRVATILWHPELRDAAYEAGADVVLFTVPKKRPKYLVGVQMNRKLKGLLSLRGVATEMRAAEADMRDIQVNRGDLDYVGQEGPIANWFLHDSLALVLCGSRTHKPAEGEYTLINPNRLANLVSHALSKISRENVTKWHNSE